MDTTEQYIEMCRKAVEVQELAPEIATRIHTRGNIHICSDYNKGNEPIKLGGFFYCIDHLEETEIEGQTTVMSTTNIWLPRQDQLQEIFNGKIEYNIFEIYSDMEDWLSNMTGDSYAHIHYDKIPFTTMEQLWLAFVMKEKFNKTWNGTDWEFTK